MYYTMYVNVKGFNTITLFLHFYLNILNNATQSGSMIYGITYNNFSSQFYRLRTDKNINLL